MQSPLSDPIRSSTAENWNMDDDDDDNDIDDDGDGDDDGCVDGVDPLFLQENVKV